MGTKQESGSVVQTWLPHPLDKELRQHAADKRRSLSQTIRLAVEDQLRQQPPGEDQAPGVTSSSFARPGAGSEEE